MTHEFKKIVDHAIINQLNGLKSVLATVVYLVGSSYRKPGVRMLISENGKMTGAVSGGCVEAEIRKQSQSVFKDDMPIIMAYDGRYRLGCEGVLYILIEPFNVSSNFAQAFETAQENRQSVTFHSYYKLVESAKGNMGSIIEFEDKTQFELNQISNKCDLNCFTQVLQPNLKLQIIGAEHDAVKLCQMASLLGWDIDIVCSINDPKNLSDFPGARSVYDSTPELIDFNIDDETVVVLMTHNYALDLKYLLKLADYKPPYIGILGSTKRRQQLQSDLLNYKENLQEEFMDIMHSPAGLNIGAITPEEIALSILSEILTVIRGTEPKSLRTLSRKTYAK